MQASRNGRTCFERPNARLACQTPDRAAPGCAQARLVMASDAARRLLAAPKRTMRTAKQTLENCQENLQTLGTLLQQTVATNLPAGVSRPDGHARADAPEPVRPHLTPVAPCASSGLRLTVCRAGRWSMHGWQRAPRLPVPLLSSGSCRRCAEPGRVARAAQRPVQGSGGGCLYEESLYGCA